MKHRHRYEMVKPGDAWGCTQGEHNFIERSGGRQAVVMCWDNGGGCAAGWCVDCIPTRPVTTRKGARRG